MSNLYGLTSSGSLSNLTGTNLSSLTGPGILGYSALPQSAVPPTSASSLTGRYFSTTLPAPSPAAIPTTVGSGLTANATQALKKPNSSYSGYDAAVYAAATSYLQSKTQGEEKKWLSKAGSSALSVKPGFPGKKFQGTNFRGGTTGQLYYCELCKISCAGPQTYREHLEGQKHKKKEAEKKLGVDSSPGLPRSKTSYRCELCEIVCTGQDAYAAHIRGIKHQRAIKLHQTLGKPIPGTSATVIPAKGMDGARLKIVLPTVQFVGGETLNSTNPNAPKQKVTGANTEPLGGGAAPGASVAAVRHVPDNEPLPIGQDYVEPMKSNVGKLVGYHCKLCDCNFTDVNAKDMHLKGRRHRLQFKKKVNPDLEVEIPKSYAYGLMRGRGIRKSGGVNRDSSTGMRRSFGVAQPPMGNFGPPPMMMMGPPMSSFAPVWGSGTFYQPEPEVIPDPDYELVDVLDNDRYVLKKHAEIYPSQEELTAVQKIVTTCEKALKCVSDVITDEDSLEKATAEKTAPQLPVASSNVERILKGVMRVGALAKGLLLRGKINAELVVLCAEKPTQALLKRVFEVLPQHLEAVSGEKFKVGLFAELGAVKVTSTTTPVAEISVCLTSAMFRDQTADVSKPDPPDLLNRHKCLEALASLRHAKWFQAKCSSLPACLVVLRVLRDLCQRVETWTAVSEWALELLAERVINSVGGPVTPGEAFRRIFEAISSGCLLPNGPGLLDPCEKEKLDALDSLTPQQREDISASAQHALRLIAFNKIHTVLGMDLLPEDGGPSPPRKRPIDDVEMCTDAKKEKLDLTLTGPVVA